MVWMLWLPALAAEEPCYGHTHPDRHETEHFWIEWAQGSLTQSQAVALGTAMEDAWDVFVDDQAWPAPIGSIVVAVQPPVFDGASGRTLTNPCGDRDQPRIELFPISWENGSEYWRSVAPHELHHAMQYVVMGSAPDSVGSWLWFMEASATWSELYTAPGEDWAWTMRAYVQRAHLPLHHGAEGFLDPDASAHMYGSALLVAYIDELHGGTDTVRALWEYGGTVSGERIWFPDAIEAIGIEFEPFWLDYLARMAVLDFDVGSAVGENIAMPNVRELPAEGTVDPELRPAGLGISAVRFGAGAGEPDGVLEVSFDGDPTTDWLAVLVRADGSRAGSQVIETVPIEVSAGSGVATIAFDGSGPAFLVVSPLADSAEGLDFSWSARFKEDETAGGCGCNQLSATRGSWLLRR